MMNFKEFEDLYQFYPNLSNNQNISLILISTICLLLIYKFLKSSEYIRVCEIGRPETRRRRSEECPAVYPNGWQPILESKDLKKGKVLSLFRLGYDLVVYRGQSGKVYVLDAYCPHLGANLGVGGTVVDDCVRCPFHAWMFNERGTCVSAPGVEKSKTPKAQIKVWDSIEVNGFIFVWYHMNGEKPNWFLKDNPIYCKRNHRGRIDFTLNCHIQEIGENCSDLVHLDVVHNPFLKTTDGFTLNNILSKIFAMTSDCKFEEKSVPNKHIGTSVSHMKFSIFGKEIFNNKLMFTLYGPSVICLHIESNIFGLVLNSYSIHSLIILEPMKLNWVSNFYFERSIISLLLSKLIIFASFDQMNRELSIWNNKKFISNPIIAKNEPELKKYRRWVKQFFSSDLSRSDANSD